MSNLNSRDHCILNFSFSLSSQFVLGRWNSLRGFWINWNIKDVVGSEEFIYLPKLFMWEPGLDPK